ncbi:hypothetical protein SDC9_190927 [bioreactor metagenome]|uniref:Uncharacterized protein n=1 Tax=bioreactor metagenome TaxID=1076179 RepID=A0A645HWH0_9ZZZZ
MRLLWRGSIGAIRHLICRQRRTVTQRARDPHSDLVGIAIQHRFFTVHLRCVTVMLLGFVDIAQIEIRHHAYPVVTGSDQRVENICETGAGLILNIFEDLVALTRRRRNRFTRANTIGQ